MSEFNIDDLDAVISNADSSLVQMLALQLKKQISISKVSEQQLAAVVAENAGLKSNLMFWDADNPELPYEHPEEIAMECEIAYDDTFEVHVAASMPNRKYRVVIMTDDDCQTEQVVSEEIQTPATNAFLTEVRAQGVDMFGQYHNFSEKLFIQKEAKKFAAKLRQGAAL